MRKEAKAKLAVVDAKEFGEEYHLLPVEYYDLDGVILILRGRCPAYGKFALP